MFFLLQLLGFAWLYNLSQKNGLSELISDQFKHSLVKKFVASLFLREILPLFLLVAMVIWAFALAWSLLPFTLGKTWRKIWTWKEAFVLTWALLAGIHLALWWEVPSTLWLLPGLSNLPFWLDFAILVPVVLLPMLWVLRRVGVSWLRRGLTLAGWVGLSWAGAALPLLLGHRVATRPNPDEVKTQVLLLGIDGLRPDTPGLETFGGTQFKNAYTAIPATRLLYSILWGGDPEHYSVGHIFPDITEMDGRYPFTLLEQAQKKGWKNRFFIDDGGTIGLARRTAVFDEIGMPARGWENFVNSNLSGHIPLYSAWLDLLRIFPSTNPWASMDAGLKAAIEGGRGAQIVMFHTCLAHQPIFLTRRELNQIPRWWTLKPRELPPIFTVAGLDQRTVDGWDPRRDAFRFYQIRMRSILEDWSKSWNDLQGDSDYSGATRVLFSDHGERFYHATESIRMGGVHGFDLDPWQLRIPMIVRGPGFTDGPGPKTAVSLLALRDAIGHLVVEGNTITPESLTSLPFAPVRYHTVSTESFRPSEKKYFELSAEKLVTSMAVLPEGIWVMKYDRPAPERGREVSLARAVGSRLTVFKPLLAGGAHRLDYDGYSLLADREIGEEEFQSEKKQIEKEYFRWWGSLPGNPSSTQ